MCSRYPSQMMNLGKPRLLLAFGTTLSLQCPVQDREGRICQASAALQSKVDFGVRTAWINKKLLGRASALVLSPFFVTNGLSASARMRTSSMRLSSASENFGGRIASCQKLKSVKLMKVKCTKYGDYNNLGSLVAVHVRQGLFAFCDPSNIRWSKQSWRVWAFYKVKE